MKILGLDLGASSVGWALVDFDSERSNPEENRIIDMGVRIFPEGVAKYGEGESEQSPNSARRMARQMRRQLDRKQLRKSKLRTWLRQNLYWPNTSEEKKAFLELDPYALRVKALDEPLSEAELSRVLYHLVQRRGFYSHGRSKDSGTTYKGDEKKEIVGIDKMKWQDHYRTYGEYLFKDGEAKQKKRKRYTLRAWYKDEFEAIAEKQKTTFPNLFSDENRNKLDNEIVFFQRALRSQEEFIGKCKYESEELRMRKSDPLAQIFTIYQQLVNLSFWHAIESKAKITFQELSEEVKQDLLYKLLTKKELQIKEVKEAVLGKKGLSIKFQNEWGEEKSLVLTKDKIEEVSCSHDYHKKLVGSPFIEYLKKCLKDAVSKKDLNDPQWLRNQALEVFDKLDISSREDFVAWFTDRYPNVEVDKAAEFYDNTPDPVGTLNIGRTAAENILAFMIQGYRYDQAVKEAGYGEHNLLDRAVEFSKKLSFKIDRRKGSLTYGAIDIEGTMVRNPIVTRILFEMAKVVNSVIDHYGNPDRVHIELARDLGLSPDKRQALIKTQKDNESLNQEIRDSLDKECGIRFATKSHIIKYRLWKEQNYLCAYTGEYISISKLFDKNFVDIDHIVPQGATGGSDDSYMNKVVCLSDENRKKGMQLPFEWLPKERFEKLKGIVAQFSANYPESKKNRLFAQSIEDLNEFGGFASRQLNDTRAATRHALKLLKQITVDRGADAVIPMKGKMTAHLRNNWFPGKKVEGGLNKPFIENPLLDNANLSPIEWEGDKSRLDHRHHALDALVIALATRSDVQKAGTLANKYDYQGAIKKRMDREVPWKELQAEAKKMLARIIVSFRVENKVNGPLHNKYLYGKIELPNDPRYVEKKFDTSRPISVIRKPINKLSKNEITQIVDKEVEKRVFEAVREVNPKWVPGDELPENWSNSKIISHKNGHLIKKVRIAMNKLSHKQMRQNNAPHKKPFKAGIWIDPQNNHHCLFYKDLKTGKQIGETIQLFDVVNRVGKGEPAIQRKPKEGLEFLFSLRINELVCFDITLEELQTFLSDKSQYSKIWDRVFRMQKSHDTSKGQGMYRHQSLAKIEYLVGSEAKKSNAIGMKQPYFNSLKAIKLKIDPAGFLKISYE